jgi:cob(I)alamin adenosyltransferase
MIKINRIYTRAGDDGRTVLGDGARRPKFDRRVSAIGSVDEANAFIGLACAQVSPATVVTLQRVQNDLFDVGADLCRPERSGFRVEPLRLVEEQVTWLEEILKTCNAELAPLTSFVLPGGSYGSALLHVARTIVRRAEREIVELAFAEPITPALIRYMNRLSDLLFVLARVENEAGKADILWRPAAHAVASS